MVNKSPAFDTIEDQSTTNQSPEGKSAIVKAILEKHRSAAAPEGQSTWKHSEEYRANDVSAAERPTSEALRKAMAAAPRTRY